MLSKFPNFESFLCFQMLSKLSINQILFTCTTLGALYSLRQKLVSQFILHKYV